MSTQDITKLKDKAKKLDVMVRIGKNGLTKEIIDEISLQLKKKKIVKVKMLKAFIESNDKRKAAEQLATLTNSQLIDRIGFVAVLYKR